MIVQGKKLLCGSQKVSLSGEAASTHGSTNEESPDVVDLS